MTAGDIWSENGISLFGMTSYRICKDWQYHENLLCAFGFSDVSHTGDNIKQATGKILFERWGIGTSAETSFERIHGCTPDEGANMLKGWEGIEGGGCVCHREATCLRHALALPEVNKLVNRIKGIANHFNRSDKVTCFCAVVG